MSTPREQHASTEPARRRSHFLPGIAVLVAIISVGSHAAEKPLKETADDRVDAAINELTQVLEAVRRNLEQQGEAWPQRERDQKLERPPPAAVRKLQAEHMSLLRREKILQNRVSVEAGDELTALLETIAWSDDGPLLQALVPVAVRIGRDDPRTAKALLEVARRQNPCPPAIVEGLASVGGPEAGSLLFDLGTERKSLLLLRAAGTTGDHAALGRIIDLAESDNSDEAHLGLSALSRLTPPTLHSTRSVDGIVSSTEKELGALDAKHQLVLRLNAPSLYRKKLEELIITRIRKTPRPKVKSALIVYLGLFRNQDNLAFLEQTYLAEKDEHTRLAAIAALGNLGPAAGQFILDELLKQDNPASIRKSCAHAVATTGFRRAVPDLIDLLTVPALARDAARALTRIAGEDLGAQEAAWIRWWRRQPEAEDDEVAFVE